LSMKPDVPLEMDGEIAGDTIAGKGIRVIRVNPEDGKKIAVGKENGEIELWQTSPPRLESKLFQTTDRVFDLAFTSDEQKAQILVSGHGSGMIKMWNIKDKKLIREFPINTAVTSIAISNKAELYILIVGEYNRFLLWKWNDQFAYGVPYQWKPPDSGNDFSDLFTKNDYIYSVAIANGTYDRAVTSDSAGRIRVWDLKKLNTCLSGTGKKINNIKILDTCDAISDQWRDKKQSIRAVAISDDGCYVASASNDGRLRLHNIDRKGQISSTTQIDSFRNSIRAVDLERQDEAHVLVASDAPNNEVKLYRVKVNNHDCK
jgi:WD40 repeat protein